MKYIKTVILAIDVVMMAAGVVAGTLLLGACTSDDNVAGEPTTQLPPQTATRIHITVDAGISLTSDPSPTEMGSSATRSAVDYNTTTGVRTLKFTLPVGEPGDADYLPGDRLYVWGEIEYHVRTMGGLLTIKSISNDGLSATFEGDLTVWVNENGSWKVDDTGWSATQEGDPMTWYGTNSINAWLIPAAMAADADIYKFSDNGYLDFYIEYSLVTGSGNLANKLMESAINVNGVYDKTEGCFELGCKETIFNCTISGLAENIEYYVYFRGAYNEDDYNNEGFSYGFPYAQTVTTDDDGTARFAFSTNIDGDYYYGLQLCTDSNFYGETPVFNCIIGQKEPEVKVYNLSRRFVDLSEHPYVYEAQNGDILTGELNDGYVTIAAGATVTLSDVTIAAPEVCDHAAIHCLGSANIILSGSVGNNVQAGPLSEPPAIYVPSGSTLTISGSGILYATGGGIGGAGIGSGLAEDADTACGDIVITGGTITAKGGSGGAGIGCGYAKDANTSCGTITITGGTITATGGAGAAGIGSGNNMNHGNSCDNITITGGTVTATGGENAAGIGSGYHASCGNITISDSATGSATGGEGSPYDIGAGLWGSCGEVIVIDGTISGFNFSRPYTCTISFSTRFTKWPVGSLIPSDDEVSIPRVSSITVTSPRGPQNVTVSPSSGTDFTNGTVSETFSLEVANGDELTFTATDVSYDYHYMAEEGTFVGTCTVSGAGENAIINLGEVSLVKSEE